jgi:hypothetical protein
VLDEDGDQAHGLELPRQEEQIAHRTFLRARQQPLT